MQGVSADLCSAVADIGYHDLPAEVTQTIRLLVLDTLGLIAGAARAPGIESLNKRLAKWEPAGCSTGLIGKRRYSPPTAALANGAAAHALDFDDLHDRARVHTSAVILPALLAAVEDIGVVTGEDFITAMAIGAEVHARLGLTCWNSLGKGWHPTMVFGTLAGALAVAKLLKLNKAEMGHALGMAFHQASGSAQSMRDGALSKRLGAGFAARSAVLSAFLAADGLDSTVRTLEGSAGLFSLYERDEVNPGEMLADFGSRWHVPDYSFKPFPGCRANHTVIGLGIELNKGGVRLEDISAIEVRVSKLNFITVGEKYDVSRNSVVHAQFNAAYSFARALADGRVDLRSYEHPHITEARIATLAQRIDVRPDETVDERAIEPARVRIRLTNGGEKFAESMTMPGSPDRPMSESDFLRKFHDCVGSGLHQPESTVAPLIEDIKRLESLPDVRTLIAKFPVSA